MAKRIKGKGGKGLVLLRGLALPRDAWRWWLTAEDGPAVPADPAKPEEDAPVTKWIHVATEGTYQGHTRPFKLDQAVFDSFIKNLHADPRYLAGADGKGSRKVLPFDYEHASEMDPTLGSIPKSGAGAPAWVLELETRTGTDGKVQLWALAKLGEQVQEQIAAEEYSFVSIAFTDGVDAVTGADLGPIMTSIAFTNHPFLKMLEPIAASERRSMTLGGWYGEPANSPEEGLEYTRSCLLLPAATSAADVLGQIARVVEWAKNPASVPPGVDLDQIVGDLRKIWGVPITATVDELYAQASQAAATLVTPDPASAPAAPKEGTTGMSDKLLKAICALFAKPGDHTRVLSTRMLATEEDALAAVEEAVGKSADLGKMLQQMGYPSAIEAMNAFPELKAAKAQLTDALAQIDELLAGNATQEEAVANSDVAAAVAAKGWTQDPQLLTALAVQRSSLIATKLAALPKDANWKVKGEARSNARREFLTQYGVAEQSMQTLLTTIAAGPAGQTQLPTALRVVPPLGPRALSNTPQQHPLGHTGGKTQIDLRGIEGRNSNQRLMSWIRANEPNMKDAPYQQVDKRAHALRRDPNVEILSATSATG